MKKIILLIMLLTMLAACGTDQKETGSTTDTEKQVLTVASLIPPMTDMLELIKPQLEEQGIQLKVKVLGDNVQPNVALAAKEVDANFFQHVPYMEEFNRANQANLVPIQAVYFANYGVYSKRYKSMDALPKGATISIANDVSNIDRSLSLLAQHNIIKLKAKNGPYWTLKDIIENPKNLEFKEVDLLMLSRTYHEVDAVLMTPAYAAPLNLTPKKDALITEGVENNFAITLVAREDNKDDERIKKLAEALTSPEVKKFLEDNYDETAIPAFE